MTAPDLTDLEKAVEAHEKDAAGADKLDPKMVSGIVVTRRAITERRAHAQSGAELDACNVLLERLRKVYAP